MPAIHRQSMPPYTQSYSLSHLNHAYLNPPPTQQGTHPATPSTDPITHLSNCTSVLLITFPRGNSWYRVKIAFQHLKGIVAKELKEQGIVAKELTGAFKSSNYHVYPEEAGHGHVIRSLIEIPDS